MDLAQVQLRDPSDRGRLYPDIDPGVKWYLFNLRTKPRRAHEHIVNIGSYLLVRVDADLLIANIEVIIPRKGWTVLPVLDKPNPSRLADMAVTPETVAEKFIDPSVYAHTNASYSYLRILFGELSDRQEWIGLSDSCLALIDGAALVGFFISFESSN